MGGERRFDVIIDGEKLTLIATESEEYIRKLADYINQRIIEIKKSRSSVKMTSHTRTLLILINIADDLFKEMGKNANVKQDITDATKSMNENLNEINMLKSEIDAHKKTIAIMENQLNAAKKELAEYIEAFDKSELKESKEPVQNESKQ